MSSEPSLPLLVVLYGPTASGKTQLAIELAQALGCEVLNADSRQIYREMELGTAKPTAQERNLVTHYGLDLVSPDEAFSAPDYAAYALGILPSLFTRSPVQIVCGGTGFYIRALCEGLDEIPPTPPEVRTRIQQQLDTQGLAALVAELAQADPVAYARIDLRNPRRVQRALEVYYATGRPLSHWQQGATDRPRPFRCLYLSPHWPRAQLYARIDARVDTMLAAGLLAEVQALMARYGPGAPGLQAIGYAETVAHLQGQTDYATLVARVKQHTRNYAKRQLTWLRQLPQVQLLDMPVPGVAEQALTYIRRHA
ncbi:MAG: tRNA (adenosine(37)-N6)-dimethylallyltransferase MiaA [Bacteroidetes bacterium]|nr:tRNA (adenosine(37)-N6)-dimethylallyltransferase MiaA [Bacteroidota bacterium]